MPRVSPQFPRNTLAAAMLAVLVPATAQAQFAASIELSSLNGSDGFALNGGTGSDFSGRAVSGAGDINGDGIDDLIVGADRATPNGYNSGQSYVVFGSSAGFGASLELSALDGGDGFALNGGAASDFSGRSVSGAGDINGDGIDDLIIGAFGAAPNGGSSGQSYVVFGRRTPSAAPIPTSVALRTAGLGLIAPLRRRPRQLHKGQHSA